MALPSATVIGRPRGGKRLKLVGVKTQGFANQERGLGDGIGGAVREYQIGFDKAAHRKADEIQQRLQFAGARFWKFRFRVFRQPGAAFDGSLALLGHQDLVQRAAASSSCSRAAIQLVPFWLSSRFQNGALAFR